MQTSQALRSEIQRQRSSMRTKAARYTTALKRAVSDHVRARRKADVSFEEMSTELTLPVNTLRRWLEGSGNAPALASVRVVEESSTCRPVLVTPSGHRVEGLTLAALADLLGRLR